MSQDNVSIDIKFGNILTDATYRQEASKTLTCLMNALLTAEFHGARTTGSTVDAYETHAEYLLAHPTGDQQEIPIDPPAANMPQTQIGLQMWQITEKMYDGHKATNRQIISHLATRMPPFWHESHRSDTVHILSQSLAWWRLEVAALAHLTPQQLQEVKSDMLGARMQPNQLFVSVLAKLNAGIRQLANSGDPLSNAAQVAGLKGIVQEIPHFDLTLRQFDEQYHTVAEQTLARLAAMLQRADDVRSRPATTTTMGYQAIPPTTAAAVALTINATTVEDTKDELIRTLRADLKAATAKPGYRERRPAADPSKPPRRPAGPPRPPVAGPPRQPRPRGYCWTHGHAFHASADCRKPSDGHIDTATATNMQGGNPESLY